MKTDEQPAMSPPLARTAAGGALYMGGAQGIRALLMIITTIVVARILSPSDYGVLAMWAPILALVQLFQDLGFSAATVQAKEVRRDQSTTLFWVNVIASVIIALLLVILSPAVANFYEDARVGYVTAASAGMVFLSSFAIQHTALLAREMRYRLIAGIIVSSAVASAATTVVLAYYLSNYWALFLGTLAGTITQLILTWQYSDWRPGARAPWRETRALVYFGGYVAAFDLLNFLNRNADSVLIGRFWGAAPLGLFERSQKLMLAPLQLVNAPLARVVLPVLSRLREEPERYRTGYLFNLRALLLVTFPAGAIAAATSDAVVEVLLGPQWRAAAPIFFWLALATLYQPLASSTGWLFLSSGRAKAFAGWALATNVVILASFLIGLPWGPAGIAKAYAIGGFLRMPLLLYWAPRNTSVRTSDIVGALVPFVIAGAGTWAVASLLARILPPLPLLATGILLSYTLAIASLCALPAGRAFLLHLVDLLARLRRDKSLMQAEIET